MRPSAVMRSTNLRSFIQHPQAQLAEPARPRSGQEEALHLPPPRAQGISHASQPLLESLSSMTELT